MARKHFASALIALCVVISFFLGLTFTPRASSAQGGLPERMAAARATSGSRDLDPLNSYSNVLGELKERYNGTLPTDTKLTYAAVRGLLDTVDDPYTQFLDPEEAKQLNDQNEGEFVGIGALLESQPTKDGFVRISRPLSGTPAQKAGIQKGDLITKVDGKSVVGMTVDQVVKLIRGQPDTAVKILIQRPGATQPQEFKIVRKMVEIEVVEDVSMKEGGVGYLVLNQFNQRADEKLEAAVRDLETQGMKALIIDLRNNPGGLLDVAIDVVSRFIPPRDLSTGRPNNAVIIVESGGQQDPKLVKPRKYMSPKYPIVVLVNRNSASASEIVAGAFKDTHAGTVVGTTTFGKGLVQTVFSRPQDGSAIKITTHKYLTSKGHDINRTRDHRGGVEPDVQVDLTEEDFFNRKDPQLDKALEILHQKIGYVKPAGGTASAGQPAPVR